MKKFSLFLGFFFLAAPSTFALSDIEGSDFETYINNAYEEGIISGYDDGTFRPDNTVSFIESLKIAINTGLHKNKIDNSLAEENWYTPFVDYYHENQQADDFYFENDEPITRDFAIYLILRQLDIELEAINIDKIQSSFPDINPDTPLAPYILFAKLAGITNGYSDGTFGPKNTVTRWELTKMVWRTLRENSTQIQEKYLQLVMEGLLEE